MLKIVTGLSKLKTAIALTLILPVLGILVTSPVRAGVITYDYSSDTLCDNRNSCRLDSPLWHPEEFKNTRHKIKGRYEHNNHTHNAYKLTSTRNGLGVRSTILDTSGKIDGFGPDDSVILGFSGAEQDRVNLLGMTVFRGRSDFNDDFNLWVDGLLIGKFDVRTGVGGEAASCTAAFCTFDFGAEGLRGQFFKIEALRSNDEFRILNATFRVPEPSMLSLLGLGLIGFGFYRRRNRA